MVEIGRAVGAWLLGAMLAGAGGGMVATPASAQGTYPIPGRTITVIVPFSAGGPTDVGARMLAGELEKELGTTFVIVNRPGAATQVGNTELFRAKPDGYTIAVIPPPSISVTYLDPDRKAPYGRKDFQAVAHYASDANLIVVAANSPYRTLTDLVHAARAKPRQIRVGTSGLMGNTHLAGIGFEEAAGVSLAFVHFNGAADQSTALLGGNIDLAISSVGPTLPHYRAGGMRVLGAMDSKPSPLLPDVKTLRAQGYDVLSPTSFAVFAPAGTPMQVVRTLSAAIKRAMDKDEFRKKVESLALVPDYMDTEEFTAFWVDTEARMKRLLAMAKQRQN